MSCQQFEEWLALDVGGDLGANEAAKLPAHLSQCEECRRFAEELQASQASFRALHNTALPEDRLASVRSAVLDELGKKAAPAVPAWESSYSPIGLRPRWVVLGLTASLLVAISFWSPGRPGPADESPPTASIPAIESLPPEVRANPEEEAAEDPPIETSATPRAEHVSQLQGDEVVPEIAPTVAVNRVEEKPPLPATNPQIEVVSMPDAETDDPDANTDIVLRLASSNPDITIYWLVGQNGD